MLGNRYWALLFFVFLCFTFSEGLIHHLHIRDDTRGSFFIENFGFLADGVLSVNLTDFKNPKGSQLLNRHGIVIKRSQTNYQRFLSDHPESECLLDEKLEPFEKVITIPPNGEVVDMLLISPEGEGFYSIYFVSCGAGTAEISFDMELILRNPGPNYLSAGEQQLPIVYGIFTAFYVIIIAYWIWFYMLPGEGRKVMKIHYLMTITALLKLGSLFFHAVELHFLAQVGHPGGWTWVYLVFSLLKGVMFFFVVALIGTGWAFIKPYLTERDRNVLLIVIPLQVISNAALIYVEETSPGSQEWFTLYDIFRLVDIICCVAILVPIMGSIKHLQEAAQVDGKAARNVAKLRLFREFYMLVVSYVYFTRIIVFLLDSTLLFEWVWISTFVSEVCTIAFFSATGYYFRPVVDNPYLKQDEDEDDEKL